ncbi:pentapeptide repeat-containing protein [Idiomarina seosinensis]|uniref:pentapeptide repeat-containing protein n=1 Tax=Idiomarina seosinensis TaxID=281739 RepID=UPI00384DBEF2
MTQRTFHGDELKGKNLSLNDLSGCVFDECDLTNTAFTEANLQGATFNRCRSDKDGYTKFSTANLRQTCWHGCQLENADLDDADVTQASIRNSSFKGATARNSHWDDSRLDAVDFSNVDFDLASFRNVKVIRVKFRPALTTGISHFLRLLKQPRTSKRTIFTAGTELSPFIEYCSREYRLSQLLLEIEELSWYRKLPRVLFAAFIGLISDFGHSLSRWLISSLLIVSSFGIYFSLAKPDAFSDFGIAWHHSLLHFINLGSFSLATNGIAQTLLNVIGYFMLGILISIITNRFVSRW